MNSGKKAKRRIITLIITLSILVAALLSMPSNAATFKDVNPTDTAYTAITWAVNKGITTGISEDVFAPQATCNHGQVITYLWRASGKPAPVSANPFTNVSASSYYYQAALWAHEKGLVTGTTFNAGADCTRLAAVTYLWKAAGSPEPSINVIFSDVLGNSKAVSWAVENGITNGFSNGEFRPNSTCTRSQIIMFLYRDLETAGKITLPAQSPTRPKLPENGKYEVDRPEGTYVYEVENGKISLTSKVTFNANDGNTYYGPMVGNRFSGETSISYNGADTYKGNVARNMKSGQGIYVWANGDSYNGQWSSDKMNGQGTYSFADGGNLKGTFVDNAPSGQCVYTDASGNSYATTWSNGVCVNIKRG